MKKVVLLTGFVFVITGFMNAQVFLSPNKNGTPVPESAKDYIQPTNIVHLSADKKELKGNDKPVTTIVKEDKSVANKKEEVPVVPSNKKNKISK